MKSKTLLTVATIALSVIASSLFITLVTPGVTATPPAPSYGFTGNREMWDRYGFYVWEEFVSPNISSNQVNSFWTRAWSGTGADAGANTVGTKSNQNGVCAMTTGTTTTGYAYMRTTNIFFFGSSDTWEMEVGLDSIFRYSDATNAYSLRVGFHDGFGVDNMTDGVYFLYDSTGVSTGSTASQNWQCVTASNNNRTFFETTTPVTLTPQELRILIMPQQDGSGDSAVFIIDDVVVRSETSNIPAGRDRATGAGIHMRNSAGTVAGRTIWYDYIMLRCDYARAK